METEKVLPKSQKMPYFWHGIYETYLFYPLRKNTKTLVFETNQKCLWGHKTAHS